MLLNYLSIYWFELTTHPAIANFYLFAKLFGKAARKQVPKPKIVLFPGPVTAINWVLVLLFVLVVLMIAIAILRVLFGFLYVDGSQDKQLLPLMQSAKIPSWKALKQQTGISDNTLWQLRDGNLADIKFSQLQQICQTLDIPLGTFLHQFGYSIPNPQVNQLQTQLQTLTAEKNQFQQQITNLKTENNQLQQQIASLKATQSNQKKPPQV